MSKVQRWRLGWIIGAAIIALILYHVTRSPQWKNFHWDQMVSLLLHLKARLLIAAICLSCITYAVRASRWRYFVNPVKRCSFRILFAGQVLGFSSIYLIGRAGEIVRPGFIARKEGLPFMSQLAVLVLERIFDSFALVILFGLALYFEPTHAGSRRSALLVEKAHTTAIVILILCGASALFLAVFRIYSEPLLEKISHALRFAPRAIRTHLMHFLVSFASGLKIIHNPWDFSATIAVTAVLWIINVSVVWLDFISLGGRLAALTWWDSGMIAFLGALGLLIQLPGVGGGYQVAVLLALEDIFQIPAAAAADAAILTYLTVMAPCIVMGLGFAIHEGLTVRKLKLMAEIEDQPAPSPS